MKWLRFVAVAIVLLLGARAIEREAWIPYRLNLIKKQVEASTTAVFPVADRMAVALVARHNLEQLAPYRRACATDVDLWMETAASDRLLGRADDAIAAYQTALTIERRPEIFFNLGITQLGSGHRPEAIDNLARALRFNPQAGYIGDAVLSAEIVRRIQQTSSH